MASYRATIPAEIPAKQVFDAVNGEVAAAMNGIVVTAAGDERMADFFSIAQDEVFKACTDPREILDKLSDGASLGRLCVDHRQWNVRLSRHFPKQVEDDCSIPLRDHYSVTVTLKSYPHIINEARKLADHASWLAPLEPPMWGNRVCENWGSTTDLLMLYRIPIPDVLAFLRKLGLGENQNLEAYGEVQEKVEFKRFSVDLKRFGFRGCYSVYPEWPIHSSTNYRADAYGRFCTLVDSGSPGVLGSVGKRYCSFRCQDGRNTRTLALNQFDIYRTKTRRSLTVSFEQYADEDPPVGAFSGGVRKRLAALGMKI
jgi:hypothetical protein